MFITGAGHVHGTLWVDLGSIERQQRLKKGKQVSFEKKEKIEGLSLAFKKIKDSEKLTEEDTDSLATFVDTFITVSTCEKKVGKDLAATVRKVNQHRHTKTCRKYGGKCRFNYPRPPSPHTIIVQPVRDGDTEKRSKILIESDKLIGKVMSFLEDEDSFKKLLEDIVRYSLSSKLQKIMHLCLLAKVRYEDYIKALSVSRTGYSVVYERDIDELYINPYNIEWMQAWDGNMDLQPCLDYFAVSTYIADYYAKDDTAMMTALKTAMNASNATDIKEKMKIVANMFLTHRQIGEAEAVYRLIPSLTLSMSNITCQFLSTSRRDERSLRWRRATEEDLQNGVSAKKLENHDGLWYEQPDMWSKYLRRPEKLKEMCCAQFVRMYKGFSPKKEDNKDDDMEAVLEDDNDIWDEAEEEDGSEDNFHFIMTFRDNGKNGKPLPLMLPIRNPYPGEATCIKKRSRPAALRYHKYKKDNDHKRYMLSEVMKYVPLEQEVDDDQIEDLYNDMVDGVRKVDIVKRQVMPHLESVVEARYHVDQMMKEVKEDLQENAAARLDPMGVQDDDDCKEEGEEEHEDYMYCDPDNVKKDEPEKTAAMFRRVEIPLSDELRRRTENLDMYQKEIVNRVVTYAKDLVKARKLENSLPDAVLLMAHGGAGAGKSTVINVIALWFQKILQQEGDSIDEPYVLKTSFTGCAAANIEGLTLSSAFGLPFGNKHFSLSDKVRDQKIRLMKNLKLLIIDEISMVKADMLYQLDLRLQEVKEKIGTPFGGVSVIAFGDLMQLAPTIGRYVFQEPANPDFHITHRLDERWQMFSSILLEKNHRQGKDKLYADLLNRVRVGEQTEEDLELLTSRVRKEKHKDLKKVQIHIGCKRKDVADRNLKYILKLPGLQTILPAKHHTPTQKRFNPYISKKDGVVGSTQFISILVLKPGAKVMIIHNIDVPDMLCNGQLGVLEDMIKTDGKIVDVLVIKLQNSKAGERNREKYPRLREKYPECVFIERVSFQYTLGGKKAEVGTTATVIQFPVRLAHAITAHKVQGQTFVYPASVAMDLSSVFEPGQAYVMLSRVQCIEQLYIVGELNEEKIRASPAALSELKRLKQISFNNNPTPWHIKDQNTIKIGSVNCMGLLPHFRDIRKDSKLLNGHVLHLLETSLPADADTDDITIHGYKGRFLNIGNGKGISTFSRDDVASDHMENVVKPSLQISKVLVKGLDSISVYRSSNHSIPDLSEALDSLIDVGRPTLITGDFNICAKKNPTNGVTESLQRKGFKSLIKRPTHIQGGHIDHIYWLDRDNNYSLPSVECYSPYWSDHDAILVTITERY